MSSVLPYYKMYPADAETDENFKAMSDEELGYYWRCLNHCWINGSLPADAKERARVMGRPQKTADRLWGRVGRCFMLAAEDSIRIVNRRQEKEREEAFSKSEKARKSAGNRWNLSDANAMRTHSDGNAKAMPRAYGSVSVSSSLDLGSKKIKKDDEVLLWFESEFWPAFPRHTAKADGVRAARKHLSTPELRARALEAITSQSIELLARPPDKRPHPATWINGRRWEDEVVPQLSFSGRAGPSVPFRKESAAEGVMRLVRSRIANGEEPL